MYKEHYEPHHYNLAWQHAPVDSTSEQSRELEEAWRLSLLPQSSGNQHATSKTYNIMTPWIENILFMAFHNIAWNSLYNVMYMYIQCTCRYMIIIETAYDLCSALFLPNEVMQARN